jgi:hypothetical protein
VVGVAPLSAAAVGWLHVVVLVLAGGALAKGRPLAPAAPAVRSAGLGAAAAVLAVLVVAAAPLADLVAVPAASLRVGAGLAVALAGLLDLGRRARPLPGLATGQAWAVPVAFPHLLTLPLVVAAVAAGLDLGPVAVGPAAVGMGLVAIGARWPAAGGVWAARLGSALAVLAGLALLWSGVLAV